MRTAVIMLPVSRKVVLAPRRGRLHETHGRVVDDLPVEVEDLGEGAPPIAFSLRDDEGYLRATYIVHGGRSYVGRTGDWTNAPPAVAVDMLSRQLAGFRDVVDPSVPPEDVVDGGYFEQEAERQSLEDRLILAGGRLYDRAPVPRWGYLIEEGGRVRFGLVPDLDDWIPSWQTYPIEASGVPLHAVHQAEAVAEKLREAVPGKDWRRFHPQGFVFFPHPRWGVDDASVLEGLSYEDGGVPRGDEAQVAYAMDLVALLRPHVGYYPEAVVIQFAFLRQALADRGDVRSRLAGLVAELVAARPGEGIPPAEASYLAEAVLTLRVRLGIPDRGKDGSASRESRIDGPARRALAATARIAARLMRAARLEGDGHEWQGVARAAEASGVEVEALRLAAGCSRTVWRRWSDGHSAPAEGNRASVRDAMIAVVEAWASGLDDLASRPD